MSLDIYNYLYELIISIKLEFVSKILSGEKKYEFKRRIFTKEVDKIYIYPTMPNSGIVAYFNPEKIIKDTLENLWKNFKDVFGTTKDSLLTYFPNKDEAYAIEITNLHIFDNPIIPKKFHYSHR